jgi:hypothetical protein
MNKKLLTIAIALVIFVIVVAPVSAAVTIEKSEGTNTNTKNLEIAPGVYDMCTYTDTTIGTFWSQNDILIRFDVDGYLSGTCVGGTSIECKETHKNILGMDLQNVVNVGSGTCRYFYPDGTKAMRLFHSTWVDGEYQVNFDDWI